MPAKKLSVFQPSGRFARLLIFASALFLAGAIWPDRIVLAQQAPSASGNVLVGHWRKTIIRFGSPQDTHIVLRPGGIAQKWVVTASSRSGITTGRWESDGRTLMVDFGVADRGSSPYTIYQGQLVYPNIQNRRGFWKRIE
jgi:hypothetical protein